MEEEERQGPSKYSLAPRTYLPPEKKYSSEDLIKAEITVEKFELYDKGYDTSTYMVLLWLQTEHTSANRLYFGEGEEDSLPQVIDHEANKEGQVSITWAGTTVKLLGYYKEQGGKCMLCGNSTKEVPDLPSIGVRVYILGSEGRGWVEYGNAVIEADGRGKEGEGIDIVNTFLQTENQDYIVGKLVVSRIDPPLAKLHPAQGYDINVDFSAKDAKHWREHVKILQLEGGRAVSNVLEPRIGYGVYVIPRAFFFLEGYRPMYFNPNWLEALLSYSFKIHQVEHLELGQGYNKLGLPSPTQFVKGKTVQELGGMFRAAMIAFVHGLTFFVTRFIYQPDKYPSMGGREGGLEVEIYSKDVLTIGAGDCEDVAYLLQQMCLEIKRAKTDKGIIGFCKRMLQYYIPVHCLVQAVAPKMPTHVGTASEPVIVEYGLCHLKKAQETMTHYHVVAILIPTSDIAKFFARAAVGLKDKTNPAKLDQYKKLVHLNRKELGMPIQETGDNKNIPPYHKLVTRLIMEGTSSIHADHLKRALSSTQVEALGVAVQAGEEPIKGYTFQNFDGGSIMYGAGIQFASEEFLKVAQSPLATVVVTMEDGDDYLGPMEYMLSYQSYAKKIKLIPGLETPVTTPIPAWYDPPTPVLTVPEEEFYEKLKNMPTIIQYPDDPVIGKWSKEATDIPYLPWNLTTPKATPQYLSGLKTA